MKESHRKIIAIIPCSKLKEHYNVFLNYEEQPSIMATSSLAKLIHNDEKANITTSDIESSKGKVLTIATHSFKNCIVFIYVLDYPLMVAITKELL